MGPPVPPGSSWDPPESCRRGARSQGTAGAGAVSPRGGPHGRGAPGPPRPRRIPRADREMLPPGAPAGPILEEQERDQNSTSSAPRARSASPRKALEPGQSFQGTSGTSGAPRAEQRLGRSGTSTETPWGPCSEPRAAPSAVRAPDTTVPTSLGGQSLGVALEEQHVWAGCPAGSRSRLWGWVCPGSSLTSPRPLLPSLTCSRASWTCRRVSASSLWSSPRSCCITRSRCCRRERLPRSSSRSLCRRTRVTSGCPGPPSSSCRALPKDSAQAGRPGPSCQGGTTPALMHVGKELGFGRSVPRNSHPSLKPCLLLCPSQIQLSLSLPGLPRDLLACRVTPVCLQLQGWLSQQILLKASVPQ